MRKWQLRDLPLQAEVRAVIDATGGQCALAGAVGAQTVVPLRGVNVPDRAGAVPITCVDALGFEPSIEAERTVVEIAGGRYPTASPAHVLGLMLAAPQLHAGARFACFVLMRVLGNTLDLEKVRGVLERSSDPDRQSLLAELA